MLLADQEVFDIKNKMGNLIDLINASQDNPIRSVIVKIASGTPYVSWLSRLLRRVLTALTRHIGRLSKHGSFTPAYNDLLTLPEDLLTDIQSVYTRFKTQNPLRRTLFFRYNVNNDKFELFTASSMVLSSKVF